MDQAKVCRICLITDVKMYDLRMNPLDLYTKSIYLKEVETLTSTNLPPFVCFECAAMMKNTYLFTEKCMRGQTALCNLISSRGPVTEHNVRQINRYDLNLVSNLSCHKICMDSLIDVIYEEPEAFPVKLEVNSDDNSDNEPKCAQEFEVKTSIKHDKNGGESFSADSDKIKQNLQSNTLKKEKKIIQLKKVQIKTKSAKCKGVADKAVSAVSDFDLEEEFNITVLSTEEQLKEIEKRKSSSNYLKSAFKCELCYKGFLDAEAAANHRSRHDPESGNLECDICKFRFKSRSRFSEHTVIHAKRYTCKACPYVSSTSAQAKRHHLWHRGVTYRCKHCEKVLATSTAYLSHVRLKHPSDFVCGECGHSFVSRRGLAMHKSLMHKEKGVREPVEAEAKGGEGEVSPRRAECCAPLASRDQENKHVCGASARVRRQQRNYSGAGQTIPTTCELCGEAVGSRRALFVHFRRAHPAQRYPAHDNHVCDQCGKTFQAVGQLRYHQRAHSLEKPHACAQCGRAFATGAVLRVHARAHSDARPFACAPCRKAYKYKSALDKHLQASAQHRGLRPYKCELCDKAFSESGNLRVHVRTVHLKQPLERRTRTRKRQADKSVD